MWVYNIKGRYFGRLYKEILPRIRNCRNLQGVWETKQKDLILGKGKMSGRNCTRTKLCTCVLCLESLKPTCIVFDSKFAKEEETGLSFSSVSVQLQVTNLEVHFEFCSLKKCSLFFNSKKMSKPPNVFVVVCLLPFLAEYAKQIVRRKIFFSRTIVLCRCLSVHDRKQKRGIS